MKKILIFVICYRASSRVLKVFSFLFLLLFLSWVQLFLKLYFTHYFWIKKRKKFIIIDIRV